MRHIEALNANGEVVAEFDVPPVYGIPIESFARSYLRKMRPDIDIAGLTFREKR